MKSQNISEKSEQNSSGIDGEQTVISKYLTEENGVYKLTLPKSRKIIQLYDSEVRFVPYVTDALVEAAEDKVAQDVAEFSNHSGFYLQINDDYLCLAVEVIQQLGSDDHKHVFFSERISSRPVKEDDNRFSYTDESAMYPEGTPGVKRTGFKNTAVSPEHKHKRVEHAPPDSVAFRRFLTCPPRNTRVLLRRPH